MADFKYQDEAMPVQRFYNQPAPESPSGPGLPTTQTAPARPKNFFEFSNMSNDQTVDFMFDNYSEKYAFEQAWQTAQYYADRYERNLKEYEEQSWWEKLQAATSGIQKTAAEVMHRTAPAPFELIARGIDKVSDYLVETDPTPASGMEQAARDKAMYSSGAAFIAALHKKLDIKKKPSFDLDYNLILDEGLTELVRNLESTNQSVRDFLLQDMGEPDPTLSAVEQRREQGPVTFGNLISPEAKEYLQRSDAYVQEFLSPDAVQQDRLAILDGWKRTVNDFLTMGPQIAGQVAATAALGPVGGTLFMFPQIYGSKYRRARELGADVNKSISAALIDSAVQLPMEAFGMGVVLRGLPKGWITNPITSFITNKILGGATEYITEWAQSFPDQFTEAMADPKWVEAFMAKDMDGKEEMILDRAKKAAKTGMDEALIGGLWGMILGGGSANIEIARRFNKRVDDIVAERAGKAVAEDIIKKAGEKAKTVPTEIKKRVEADEVLDNAIADIEDEAAIQRREAEVMPVTREIEPIEPAEVKEPIEPIEAAEPVEPEIEVPPEVEAMKETHPDMYQLWVDTAKAQKEEGIVEKPVTQKAKEPTAPKAKKAPAKKKKVGLSAEEKIERLWGRLDDKQKAKVKDLYENVIEPMPAIERYQMMQADLVGEVDLKVAERPTLEEWRSQPELRPEAVRKGMGAKVFMAAVTGRKAKQINRAIDAAYELTYGKEAMTAEKALIQPTIKQKVSQAPTAPEVERKPQERPLSKAERAKLTKTRPIIALFEKATVQKTPGAKEGDVQPVRKLSTAQKLIVKLSRIIRNETVDFFTTTNPLIDKTAAAVTDAGIAINAGKEEAYLLALFGHETWHEIQDDHPDLAKAVQDLFWESVNAREFNRYAEALMLTYLEIGQKKTEAEIKKEFEADYIGSLFGDPVFLRKLIKKLGKENPTLLRKLFDILNNLLSRIKNVMIAQEQFVYLRKNEEELENLVTDAFTELRKRTRSDHPRVAESVGLGIKLSLDLTGTKKDPERVKMAAYRYAPTGEVFEGIHHGEAYQNMMDGLKKEPEFTDIEDGFTTTHGRFVDRHEALEIADKNEQIRKEATRSEYLISEDVKPEDVKKLYTVKDGKISFKGDPSLKVKVVSIISALNNGGDFIELDPYAGDTEVIKSLGFEEVGQVGAYNKYEYKGEIYEPSIIAGRYEAAWNATFTPDGTATKLLDAVRDEYAARKRGEVGEGTLRDSEEKLSSYLKKHEKSYAEGERVTSIDGYGKPTKNIRVKGGKSEIALIQISSLRAKEEATAEGDSYFDKLYSLRDGYTRPTDFWEIPTWMAHAAKTFKNADAYVVRNMAEAIEYLKRSGYESIMFSSMDANKQFIRQIAEKFDGEVIIGGYADPKYFSDLKNVKVVDSLEAAAKIRKVPYKSGVDYRQFKGTKTVPRLEMSQGCLHKCAFCTVPKKIITQPLDSVLDQVENFKGLDFKLIYLNDKTFGQADNYTDLVEVFNKVKKINPKFQGFIIQTTAPAFNKLDNDFLKKSGIKYVELGMESFNDDILKKINKPHRVKHIIESANKMRDLDINFIPNVMVGLAGIDKTKGGLWSETDQTYRNTLHFLQDNFDIISHLNVYVLATYEGTQTGKELGTDNEVDNDENVISKSWLDNKALHQGAYRRFLKLGTDALEQPKVQESVLAPVKEDPVLMPPKMQTDFDPEDMDFGDPEDFLHEAVIHLHNLEFKRKAYDFIPEDKMDTFAKHYKKETDEEHDRMADVVIEGMKYVYDKWLYHHVSPEQWVNSMFGIEGDESIGLLSHEDLGVDPAEMFTNEIVGYMRAGNTWQFDVSDDVREAVEEQMAFPELPKTKKEVIAELVNKYGHIEEDIEEDAELYDLHDLLREEHYNDYQYMDRIIEADDYTIAERLNQDGWHSEIGKIIREVLEEKAWPAWRANWGGTLDATEERVKEQRERLENAETPEEKMSAISLAMNEQHVYGTMSEHMGFGFDELEAINNLTDQILDFKDLIRRDYKPTDVAPQVQQSIDLGDVLKGQKIKISVAGKDYVINESRESIEALLSLNGGANGLERFLKDNGVEKIRAKRIVSIARSMENFPFPSVEETANDLIKFWKANPKYRDWYDDINYLKQIFENEDDLGLFVGFSMLAHTSRNKGTLGNMIEFVKFRSFQKAGQLDPKQSFGLVEQKTIERVLAAENIDEMFNIRYSIPNRFKEGEVKVKAFAEVFAALLKNPNGRAAVESVVDIWVNRYFFPSQVEEDIYYGEDKTRPHQPSALTGVQHLRIQRHMREVEALMTKKTGETWVPDQVQAVMWFFIRDQWEQARGKKGQKGYTFDETIAILAARWAGVPEATPRQVEAFIKLKLRDPEVRLVLDAWTEEDEISFTKLVNDEQPVILKFYDAGSMPKDIDPSGKTRQRTVIDTTKVYNADVDSDNLIDAKLDIHDTTGLLELEAKMRNAGWVGLRSGNVTVLFEPTRVQPMKRAVLNVSAMVEPDVMAIIKKSMPTQYKKLQEYQELYEQGKDVEVLERAKEELIRIFSHPLMDIRSIEPAEGRWKFGSEPSFDVEFDFADINIAKGLMAQFLKNNAQYEGVISEYKSGWNDPERPKGVAQDQAPSIVLKFKKDLSTKQLEKVAEILNANGISGSTYTPEISSITLHHFKARYNEKAVGPALMYKGELISGEKSHAALYKKAGIDAKTLKAEGGQMGHITNRGNFVDSKTKNKLQDKFGKVILTDNAFLSGALASVEAMQREMPDFSGFGTVWYNHHLLSNDWTKNKEGEEYDKKIQKATTVSRNLGIIAEPTIVAGRERVSPEALRVQGRGRVGEVKKLSLKAKASVKEFVKKKPLRTPLSAAEAAKIQGWKDAGINVGPAREKALKDFNEGKKRAPQAKLFESVLEPLTDEEAKARKEAYANAPDNLLGFSKDPFIQKGFYDQNYSYTVRVRVHYPRRSDFIPGQTFFDEIRGLNKLHALARARRNWSGARISFVDGYKNNERDYRVQESILVYHGTGAEYSQYDLSYIKTGEGFLAFGWGQYFTSKRGIAEDYARKLASAGRFDTLKLSLPIDQGRALKDYTILESGVWNTEFGRTVMDAKGNEKYHLVGSKEVDSLMWARNEVARHIRQEIDGILGNLDQVTEGDVRRAIKDILYDMTGHLEYVQMQLRQTDEKAIYVPSYGMINERLSIWLMNEVYEWERAMDDRMMHELKVEGGKKIVHKAFLDDDLKFIDWYKTVSKKNQNKIIAAAKKYHLEVLKTEPEPTSLDPEVIAKAVDIGVLPVTHEWETFEDRVVNNPTLPLLKDIYHEMVSLFGNKRDASMVLQRAGWDGIRYEADSLYGDPPKKVQIAQEKLQEALYGFDLMSPSQIPIKLRDVYHVMSKLVDGDPDYIKLAKDNIPGIEKQIDAVHDAIENHWGKNYVVFHKVEDPNFVQISEKFYLSLDAFSVQNRGTRDYLNSKVGNADISFKEKYNRMFKYFVGDSESTGNWRYLVFDKLDPIKQWLGGEGHAYMKARGVPGGIGSLAAFLEHGMLEWDRTMTLQVQKNPETGKAFRKMGFIPWMKSLGPNDGVKFFYWLIAKRAEALELEEREHWLKEADRNKILEWVGVPENKQGLSWEQINEQFQAFNKNILDIATKAGAINKESRKSWESEVYIPFYRVIEDEILNAEFWRGPKKGKQFLSSQIRQLKGAEAKIGDPVENIMRNWTHLLTTSITNVARAAAVKYAADNNVMSGYTRTVEANKWVVTNEDATGMQAGLPTFHEVFDTLEEAKAYKVQASQPGMVRGHNWIKIKKQKMTVEEDVPLIESVAWHDTVIFKPQKDDAGKPTGVVYVHQRTGDQLLSYMVGGKQYYFKVNNPELYIAISGANPHQFNNAMMELFRTSKRWLTYGATFGPGFRIANMVRDTLHTALISKSFTPFWDTARGFVKAWKQDEAYVNYMASGHAFGGHYVKSEDPKALARYIKDQLKGGEAASRFVSKLTGKEGPSIVGRILDSPAKALRFWERIGAASENAARIQLSENLLKKGESTATAYFKARDLMDFQMSGAAGIVQFLIQTIPFLNARGQGLYKMGRAAAENPLAFLAKGALIMLASLGLWAIFRDDDRYKELEDWEKFAYYHFWIGDYHFRVPKPFETGVIFSTSVEAAANVMSGNEDLEHLWTYMKHATTETFAFNPILGIQAIKPLAEQWANKVSFTGRPIEGQGLSGLRWAERYDPWTSETMRLIGKGLNLPPKRMEHLVRGYTGTFGMFLMGISDMFVRNVFDFPDRPKLSWNEYPGAARFIKKGPARNTKYMSEFYDLYNEFSELTRTINYYEKLGDLKKARELVRENPQYYKLKKLVNRRKRDLSDINKQIRRVWLNKNMDGEQKRKRLDALTKKRNQITRQIFNAYKKEN